MIPRALVIINYHAYHGLLDSSCEAGTDTEASRSSRDVQAVTVAVYYDDHVIGHTYYYCTESVRIPTEGCGQGFNHHAH